MVGSQITPKIGSIKSIYFVNNLRCNKRRFFYEKFLLINSFEEDYADRDELINVYKKIAKAQIGLKDYQNAEKNFNIYWNSFLL